MKILKQNYHLDINPEPYLIKILDTCFENANNFYDFGCGRGHWSEFLINRYQIPFNCFDIDKDAELYTKNRLKNHLIESENNKFYDVIFLSFVIEIVNENQLDNLIDTVLSKLDHNKKNGKIFLSSSFYNPFSIKWVIYKILGKGNAKNFFLENKHYRNFYEKNDILNLFKKRGLKLANSTRGAIVPKGPKLINQFLRFIFPLEFLYDKFYLILEFDIDNMNKS